MDYDSNHTTEHAEPVSAPVEKGARAEKREAQTNRILDAARTCFVQSGFRGASMNEICREAGMSPGALYRYFPSKESIIEAIAEQDRRQDLMNLAQMGAGATPLDGFIAAVMQHFRDVHERDMASLFTEIRAESMRNDAVAACCAKTEAQFIELFTAFLTYAKANGDIDPVEDIDAIVPMMMALGEGMIMGDVIGRGVPIEKIETILRAMATSILRPVKKQPENAG